MGKKIFSQIQGLFLIPDIKWFREIFYLIEHFPKPFDSGMTDFLILDHLIAFKQFSIWILILLRIFNQREISLKQ